MDGGGSCHDRVLDLGKRTSGSLDGSAPSRRATTRHGKTMPKGAQGQTRWQEDHLWDIDDMVKLVEEWEGHGSPG